MFFSGLFRRLAIRTPVCECILATLGQVFVLGFDRLGHIVKAKSLCPVRNLKWFFTEFAFAQYIIIINKYVGYVTLYNLIDTKETVLTELLLIAVL